MLPECFWNSTAYFYKVVSKLIIVGSSATDGQPDPLMRWFSNGHRLLSNCRLINPLTNYSGGQYPYTPDWTAIFGNFTGFINFQVSGSNLQGPIPSSLPSTLALFDVSDNSLTGTIPTLSTSMSNQNQALLNVSNNQLSGTIPSNLLAFAASNFYQYTIDLSFNRFTGTIPEGLLSPISGAQASISLSLASNRLSGPIPTDFLNFNISENAIFSVSLANNSLSGPVAPIFPPSSWSDAYSVSLDASSNQLTGTIPSNVFSAFMGSVNLRYLTFLVDKNLLTGTIPTVWPSITPSNIQVLIIGLSNNGLSGTIPGDALLPPSTWPLGPSQISWSLSHNSLSGSVSGNMINPENTATTTLAVDLSHNLLTGSLPVALNLSQTHINQLTLSLASNRLSGTLPPTFLSQLWSSTTLISLDISSNGFSGSIPEAFLGAIADYNPAALYFSASNCGLNGTIPNSARPALLFLEVHLDNNQLSGAVNSSLLFPAIEPMKKRSQSAAAWRYTFMTFSASNNLLTGTIALPSFSATNLVAYSVNVSFSHNSLNALTVDPTADYVVALDVSQNKKLVGTIPSIWFANSSRLVTFNASHTLMVGPFPTVNNTIAYGLPLRSLDLSNTLISFCNATRPNAWNETQMTSCNLEQTSAHSCTQSYPSMCNTRYTTSAATTLSGSTVLSLLAVLSSLALILV